VSRVLLRLRWFVLGLLVGVGSWAWVAMRLRRIRVALSPSSLARSSALRFADALEAGSRRLSARSLSQGRNDPRPLT
jgi:hypothetical protein